MKKISFLILFLVSAALSMNAQDVIVKVNGEKILAKVLEINDYDVSYLKWDNIEGPVYTMQRAKVQYISYENGMEEIMNPAQPLNASGNVFPGMRYSEYRKLYDPHDYISMYDDRYNPALSGVCSWLIPGLGQMICGEVGRGFAFLGGSAASVVLSYTGLLMAVTTGDPSSPNSYGQMQSYYSRQQNTGVALMLLGSAAMLAVDIWAIVDGVRVAKIKNMYERDIRSMADVSIRLEPYFATTAGLTPHTQTSITAGASLKIRF